MNIEDLEKKAKAIRKKQEAGEKITDEDRKVIEEVLRVQAIAPNKPNIEEGIRPEFRDGDKSIDKNISEQTIPLDEPEEIVLLEKFKQKFTRGGPRRGEVYSIVTALSTRKMLLEIRNTNILLRELIDKFNPEKEPKTKKEKKK